MTNLVIIAESEDGFKRCEVGVMTTLTAYEEKGKIRTITHIKNVNQHTRELQELLTAISEMGRADIIIVCSDKDSNPRSFVGAYLRNHLKNTEIEVIEIAFTGNYEADSKAFNGACVMACDEEREFPAIELPEIPRGETMSLAEARQRITQLNQKP